MLNIKISDPKNISLKEKALSFFSGITHMSDKVLVIGGDGTLLHTIHEYEAGLSSKIFIPINAGTLGFLMNPNTSESWEKIRNGEYSIYEFSLLSIRARLRGE